MKKVAVFIVTALVFVGVARGIIRYNDEGGTGFQDAGQATIMAVEDVTYRWLPALLGMFQDGVEAVPELVPAPK